MIFFLINQADWKPEAPERFGDITDLATSLSSLKIEETKKQGSSVLLDCMSLCSDQFDI
jgi:translation initiation factor 2A